MVASQSPTALKRWIAFELRRLRDDAGVSRAAAAERIGKAESQIGHMETGRNLPTVGDAEHLLTLYGHPERVEVFRDLIKRAKKGRDWWVGWTDAMPEWLALYLGLESSAARMDTWDALNVPGILQTRGYAEAIISGGDPTIGAKEVSRRVGLRMERQTVLDRTDAPLQVWCVIAEHALRAPVGGPAVLAEQLDHLLMLTERPTIDVQVLPTAIGAHTGLEGTFALLTYPTELGEDLGTAYVETRIRAIYYESPEEIRVYREALTRLQVAALSPADSRTVIDRIAQEVRP